MCTCECKCALVIVCNNYDGLELSYNTFVGDSIDCLRVKVLVQWNADSDSDMSCNR